ncbi:hypothetical protein V6N12_058591 [Hibiscus sabdariffa]|uniref:Uncharacterized protein n=1 Tax=Hibiscus sabdariffa TaxID=183260 RepID=A0ABR2ESP7_9ROSI
MRKMDLTDAVPLQMAIPTPPASHQSPAETPAPSPADAQNDTPAANPTDSPAHTPEAHTSFASTPTTPPSPPAADTPTPAPTKEATQSIQLLQHHNQLQRVEARQLQLIEETKLARRNPSTYPWKTSSTGRPPHEHLPEVSVDIPESSRTRKRKTPAARIIREDTPADTTTDLEATSDPTAQPTPARRRRLNVILSDNSDYDGSNYGSVDPASSRSMAF